MKSLHRFWVGFFITILSGILSARAAITPEWVVVDPEIGNPLTDVDPAGNLYVASRTAASNNLSQFTVAKYSPSGTRLWLQNFAGTNGARNLPAAIKVNAAGEAYVTGSADFGPVGNSDVGLLTVKYDTAGNRLWAVRRDEPLPNRNYARALALDAAGDVWVAATTLAGPEHIPTVLIVKYDPSGNELWASHLTAGGATVFGLVLDAAGNGYVAGFGNIRCGADDEDTCPERALAAKIGPIGQWQWVRHYDAPGRFARFQALAVDTLGRMTAVGAIWNGIGPTESLMVQYAPDGGRRWVARSIDPTGAVLGGQYAGVDAAGNVYSASAGFRIEKHSPTGRLLWRRTDADSTQDMTVDAEGNVYAIARGFSYFPEALFAVKYDACGNRRWSYLYDTNAPAVEIGTGIALAPGGRIYLSGLLIPSAFGQHPSSGLLLALSETDEPLPPPVSIRATRLLTIESSRWTPPTALFTIARETAASEELAVRLTIGGTATPGGDYRAIPDTIIIPAGEISVTIAVVAIDDRLSEKTETVEVELAPNPAYSLCGQTRATAYILDNEPRRR